MRNQMYLFRKGLKVRFLDLLDMIALFAYPQVKNWILSVRGEMRWGRCSNFSSAMGTQNPYTPIPFSHPC